MDIWKTNRTFWKKATFNYHQFTHSKKLIFDNLLLSCLKFVISRNISLEFTSFTVFEIINSGTQILWLGSAWNFEHKLLVSLFLEWIHSSVQWLGGSLWFEIQHYYTTIHLSKGVSNCMYKCTSSNLRSWTKIVFVFVFFLCRPLMFEQRNQKCCDGLERKHCKLIRLLTYIGDQLR